MPLPPSHWLYGKTGMTFVYLLQSMVKLTAFQEPHACLILVTVICLGFASCVWPLSIPVEQGEAGSRALLRDSIGVA